MTGWTPEAIVAHCMSEIASLMLGKCPASGLPLVYDNEHSEALRYRLSCDMCDCFGYWTPRRANVYVARNQISDRFEPR